MALPSDITSPPPKTLEDLITRQREDHEGVVSAINSLANDFQVADDKRRADHKKLDMLDQIATTLKSLQDQVTEASQN